jgi:hypothetical protein
MNERRSTPIKTAAHSSNQSGASMTLLSPRVRLAAACSLSALASAVQAQALPTSYSYTELKYPAGVTVGANPNFTVGSMNNRGQVLGNAYGEVKTGKMVTQPVKILGGLLTVKLKVAESYLVKFPVVWTNGTAAVLPWVNTGTDAQGYGINDAGDVIGTSYGLSNIAGSGTSKQAYYDSSMATVWRSGKPSTIAAGAFSDGVYINNTGWILTSGGGKYEYVKPSKAAPLLWIQGIPTPLADHFPTGANVGMHGISDLGTTYAAIDPAALYNKHHHLFDLNTRTETDISVPGMASTEVLSMASAGTLMGKASSDSSSGHPEVFVRDPSGAYTLLKSPTTDWAHASLDPVSVNKQGEVAGCWRSYLPKFDASGQEAFGVMTEQAPHCGVWTSRGFIDLSDKVVLPAGEIILDAIRINDAGQVLVKVGTFSVKADPANYVASDFAQVLFKRYAVLTPR